MAKATENSMEIAALNREARRRDMTYGQLVAATTREEQAEIIKQYKRLRAAAQRRERKRESREAG